MKRYVVSVSVTVICLVVLVFGVGCDSDAKTGAVAGGAIGAGTGAIIGHQSGKTGQGALIGGAIGAAPVTSSATRKTKRNMKRQRLLSPKNRTLPI